MTKSNLSFWLSFLSSTFRSFNSLPISHSSCDQWSLQIYIIISIRMLQTSIFLFVLLLFGESFVLLFNYYELFLIFSSSHLLSHQIGRVANQRCRVRRQQRECRLYKPQKQLPIRFRIQPDGERARRPQCLQSLPGLTGPISQAKHSTLAVIFIVDSSVDSPIREEDNSEP